MPASFAAIDSVLIVIPTYNERENLETLVRLVRASVPRADLLIVDDGSPDGTGEIADTLAAGDSHIHVQHRAAKDGLGRAYVAGLGWGIEHRYDRLIQMDADLSHDPSALPSLLAASESYGLVLGSRYVPGGGTRNWSLLRRALSRFGSLYARTILALPLNDLTGGFKCWHRSVLEDIDLPSIQSNGYSFQIETTWRAVLRGHSVGETPILFTDRIGGVSKMDRRIVREAMTMVWKLRFSARAIRALPGSARSY